MVQRAEGKFLSVLGNLKKYAFFNPGWSRNKTKIRPPQNWLKIFDGELTTNGHSNGGLNGSVLGRKITLCNKGKKRATSIFLLQMVKHLRDEEDKRG